MAKKKSDTNLKVKIPDTVEILENFLEDVNDLKEYVKKGIKIQGYTLICCVEDPKDPTNTLYSRFQAIDYMKVLGAQEVVSHLLRSYYLQEMHTAIATK